jgi:ribonuclease HI
MWTAMGLIDDIAEHTEAQVLVFTETKLRAAKRNPSWPYASGLHAYHIFHSKCKLNPKQGQAGIMLGIRKDFAEHMDISVVSVEKDYQGYLLPITIHRPDSAKLLVMGMYMPQTPMEQKCMQDKALQILQSHPEHHHIVAGDFNAALFPTDRHCPRPRDKRDTQHQAFVKAARLMPLDPPTDPEGQRGFTYRQEKDGAGYRYKSRIDDILVGTPTHKALQATTSEVLNTEGHLTDHNAVSATLPFSVLGQLPPVLNFDADTKPKKEFRLVTPLSNRRELTAAAQDQLGPQIQELSAHLRKAVTEEVNPHWSNLEGISADTPQKLAQVQGRTAEQYINDVGSRLANLFQALHPIALTVCKTKRVHTSGSKHRRRTAARKRAQLVSQRNILAALRDGNTPDYPLEQVEKALSPLREEVPEAHTMSREDLASQPQAVAVLQGLKNQLLALDKQEQSHATQQHIKGQQRLANTNQKLGNKLFTGRHQAASRNALKVLNVDGHVTTDPDKIQKYIHSTIECKLSHPGQESKTGAYLPAEAPRTYPWLRSDPAYTSSYAPDTHFTLETEASTKATREWLHTCLQDRVAFEECVKRLNNGKAPGPDGVINDLIKAAPEELLNCLHLFIQLMWATGQTPDSWKLSTTILLQKPKGSPLELKTFRRIGLENTLYKVWTNMVREALANFAERHNILSNEQAGFRAKRGTQDQLEMFTMLLEDAKHSKQDFFLLQSDFTEAFDTINHDKLLHIMFDLGFPTDAIEVVKHLYTGMHTQVKTPFGTTKPIPVDRGTIQGDSLSPFLFLLYLEPLLRWLTVGGRGYTPGVMKPHMQDHTDFACSNSSYADDLNAHTGSPRDMRAQAQKISLYADWADLIINPTKTSVTGILHGSRPDDPTSLEGLQRRLGNIPIQGHIIKTQDPRAPFKLLGVHFTLDLDWSTQYKETLAELQDRNRYLRSSNASLNQMERIVRTSLVPKLKYGMCLMCYSPTELETLNKQEDTTIKTAFRLPVSAGTAFIRADTASGGLGHPSLHYENAYIAAKSLAAALNHQGKLGHLARHLLHAQLHTLWHAPHTSKEGLPAQAFRVRQLLACQRAGIRWTDGTAGISFPTNDRGHIMMPNMGALDPLLDGWKPDHLNEAQPILQNMKTLQDIGINSITQILSRDGHHMAVCPENQLRLVTPVAGVKPKHKRALRAITEYLNAPLGQSPSTPLHQLMLQAPPPLPQRTVNPSHHEWLQKQQDAEASWYKPEALTLPRDRGPPPAARHPPSSVAPPLADCSKRSRKEGTTVFRSSRTLPECPIQTRNPLTRWTTYRKLREEHGSQELSGIYNKLCSHRDQIESLGSWRCLREHEQRGRKRRYTPLKQRQWETQWARTLMEKWEIDLNIELGYEPVAGSITAASLEQCEQWERVVCEHCLKGEGPGPGLYTCPGCCRAYHQTCIQHRKHTTCTSKSSENPEADDWVCAECREYEGKSPQEKDRYQEAIKPWLIQWQPKWEDEDTILLNPGMHSIIEKKLQDWTRPSGPTARVPPPKDLHKSNLERQAPTKYTPNEIRTHNTVGDSCRNKIQVHTKPVDPEIDIRGTGEYTLQFRMVTRRHKPAGTHAATSTTQEMACVYDPEGHCLGMLTPGRANLLYLNFLHCTQRTHQDHSLQPGTFPEELALLLLRYKEGTPIKESSRRVKLSNHWTTPTSIYQCIQEELQPTSKERFASPLNYSPTMTEYWSCHQRDQLFGAHHNAYTHQWTGFSVANPEYEPKDMDKAVAWAVHSARHTPIPTVTLFILPAWMDESNTAYLKWQRKFPQNCRVVLRVPKRSFRFVRPDHAVAVYDPAEPGHIKWDVTILAVFNSAGKTAYMEVEQNLRKRLCDTINATFELKGSARLTRHWLHHTHPRRNQQLDAGPATNLPEHLYQAPSRITACHTDGSLPQLPERSPDQWGPAALELRTAYGEVHPLLLDPNTLAYTDGSRMVIDLDGVDTVRTASAVYIPEQPGQEEIDIGVDPNATGRDNSIVRAELGAANVALQLRAQRVLSDSLTSLYLIWKGVAHPADINKLHRHHALIADTVQKAIELPGEVHFHKVKAHAGIPGNERANDTAQDTASGLKPMCSDYQVPASNARENMFWPCIDVSETLADGTREERYQYVDSIEGNLKSHLRDKLELGWANKDSVYFSSFQRQLHRIKGSYLTYLARTSLLSTAEKRCRWKYLTGTLYTNKRAKWYGHSKTDICPVPGCNSRDSQGHATGECLGLVNARIAKHHAQGRILAKGISTGNQGNGLCFCFTDLGRKEHWDAEGAPILHAPPEHIPAELIDQHTWRQLEHRPDMILWRQGTTNPTQPRGRRPRIHIVEFKNCRDSDPTPVFNAALQQHEDLKNVLKERHPNAIVDIDVILIGMAGTIYTDYTIAPLKRLGLKGAHLRSVLEKAAVCAAQQLLKVWRYRWHIVRQGNRQRQARTGVG